jgi:2-aminobenzoate-CoA ligase
MADSAYTDTFAADNLPPRELWPDLINLDKLGYPERLNCAVELLDTAVADGFGDKILLYSPNGNWTYRQVLEEANRIANFLVDGCGLEPGGRVLLHGPNTPKLVAGWFAILRAGGIVVSTMPLLRAKELTTIINKAQTTIVMGDHRTREELTPATLNSEPITTVFYFGDGEMEDSSDRRSSIFEPIDTSADDVALIAFTSGTTGMPKGTMHFHRDVLAICDCFPVSILKADENDIFAGSPPLAFTFGLGGILLFPMRVRASTVMLEKAPPPELTKACQQFGVTVVFTSPTGYRFMLDNAKEFDLSRLKKCVSAGETLPKATSDAWFKATGIRIIDGIGSTEMLHIFISASGDDIRPGSTGKPIPLYEAKIIGADGETLGDGEVGRLAVRGPTGCRYLADERQKEYVRQGWNLTGDAYLRDKDGYYWFQARTDDMILSGGYNISGPEIEEALLTHPGVRECAVVGSPDEMRGNIVKAFVVLRDDGPEACDATCAMLQDFVKQQIAPYKYPRAIEFVASLPKTENGKLQRFKLRQMEIERRSVKL